MRILTLVFFACFAGDSFGQIFTEFDTITYKNNTTASIDSMDISASDLPTTFDGGRAVLTPNGLSAKTLFDHYTKPNFQQLTTWKEMQFSALPHLGFTYSFGSQGSQFITAKYNHAFSNKTLLNIDYVRSAGLGLIRNAGFTHNDVQLQFQRKGKRYTFQLKGNYQKRDVNHPGGLYSDALIEDFGLEFSPVNKSEAKSINKTGQAILKNYFNFLPDSISMLGLTTVHDFSIKNRVYTELDTIYGIYNAIYIDSFETRDQYNLAKIGNGGGIFFSNPGFYIDGVIDYAYWDYQNLGVHTDTSEIDLNSDMILNIKQFKLTNKLNFNIIGAFNEWSEIAGLNFSRNKLKVNAFLALRNDSPSPFQRRYFANNSNYTPSGLANQTSLSVGGEVSHWFLNNRVMLAGFTDFHSITDLLYFNGAEWQNDSVTRTFGSVGFKSSMQFGVLNFHPRFIYSFDQYDYLPEIQIYGRLFVKGKVFKAKKLEVVFGVDASYISAFKTKTYVPVMDTYDWNNGTSSVFGPMVNLHAFLSLGIEEFRFFFRYENIGYFWSDKTNQVVNDYPVASARLRIGLTWDFFN